MTFWLFGVYSTFLSHAHQLFLYTIYIYIYILLFVYVFCNFIKSDIQPSNPLDLLFYHFPFLDNTSTFNSIAVTVIKHSAQWELHLQHFSCDFHVIHICWMWLQFNNSILKRYLLHFSILFDTIFNFIFIQRVGFISRIRVSKSVDAIFYVD